MTLGSPHSFNLAKGPERIPLKAGRSPKEMGLPGPSLSSCQASTLPGIKLASPFRLTL